MTQESSGLEEGKKYPFKIIKYVEQTQSSPFWVLEDPFGKRHVLRSKHFIDYAFEAGNEINVTVSYVSCTGKVSLEPEHPFYKTGSIHNFKFISHDYRIDNEGKERQVLIVADKNGRETEVYPKNKNQRQDEFQPDELRCKVTGTKKGALLLELEEDSNN